MPVAKVNVGRVIPDNTMRSLNGSQDTSKWALLTTSGITSTDDPNGLETSKAMSGREFQFRGSTPGGAGLSNPDDGCLYNFSIIDPDTGATVDPKDGEIIAIEFYFKLGTNIPDTTNDQIVCGIWNGSAGAFGGYKSVGTSRVCAGSYTNTSATAYTNSSGNVYLVQIGAADTDGETKATIGPPMCTVFDDDGSPARAGGRVFASAQDLSTNFTIGLVFAGDVDAEIYYRFVYPPSSPF